MSSPSRRKSVDSFSFQSPQTSPSPRAEYPFPGHDWSSRPGPPSRLATARRGSNASTVSSIGGSLDVAAARRRNTVAEISQNAISSLLQPPILRTGLLPQSAAPPGYKAPTARDIPPVTLTNIPHVEPSAFSTYLTHVGSLFDAFQRAKLDAEGGGAQLFRRDRQSAKDAEPDSSAPPTPRLPPAGLLSPTESPTTRRRVSAGGSRRGPPAPTPLSTIPSVYFDDNFHLENPRTFDIVSERSEVVQQPRTPSLDDVRAANGSANGAALPPRKALATNAILQEKLSWYMDTVEIHLISSISQASASFFAALGSLRELESEAAESVVRINKLRADLTRLDEEMALGGLDIIAKKRRRDNLQTLRAATEQLECVVNAANRCEELVDSGDLDAATQSIAQVEQLACGTLQSTKGSDTSWLLPNQSLRIIDLRRLNALSGLSRGIEQLRLRICKGYESRLLDILLGDLRRHVSSVSTKDTLSRWANASKRQRGGHSRGSSAPPAYTQTTDKLRTDLAGVLRGLGQARHLGQASASFREAVIKEMKTLIRQHLPSSADDDAESVASVSTRASSRARTQQDKSAILARNLRALDPEAAEELFLKTYCGIGEALRRLGVQVKLLLDVTSGMKRPPTESLLPARSPSMPGRPASTGSDNLQEELSQALDMSSLLGQAVDKAQSEITKVLRVRTEQTIRLSLPDFVRYFTINRLFADECENVSGRSGASLKGVVNNQIHDFVPLMLDTEKQKLAQVMDPDKWDAADFQDKDAATLSCIMQAMTSDPAPWLHYTDPVAAAVNGAAPSGSSATTEHHANGVKGKARTASIEEEKFILVQSTIFALGGIERYGILIASIPSMVSEISSALLDYLRLFNSRAQQLLLGAGATRTAGLVNINTKHLALASQSLSFVITLVPYLREYVRRRPQISPTALAEYDRVKRLYQDHQASIHEKIIDIMSGRATANVKIMMKMDFDADAQRNVSRHMEVLTKETSTLHRTLSKYLPEITVSMIMGPVFVSYKEQWVQAFEEASVNTEEGRERLIRDAELFKDRLSHIDSARDVGAELVQIAKGKQVAPAPRKSTSSATREGSKPDTSAEAGEAEKEAG